MPSRLEPAASRRRRTGPRPVAAVLLIALSVAPAPAVAADPPREGGSGAPAGAPEDAGGEDAAAPTDAEGASPARPEPGPGDPNPCKLGDGTGDPLLDRTRRRVFETVCTTARWVDGLFGGTSYRRPARELHGRLGARLVGDEDEGAEADLDLWADYSLPNLERRVDLFLGRENRDDLVSDQVDEFRLLPDFFRRANEEQWLFGMGYRPLENDLASLDLDVGVELVTPLEPYTRARYRRYWVLGSRYLARLREAVYWQNQRGLGTTTGIDLERTLGSDHLLRLANRARIDEASEGVEWRSALTWFHLLDRDRALAWLATIEGESDAAVPVKEWGLRVTYRQRMLREWFFGELLGGVAWNRDRPEEPREEYFHVGVGFEIQFGYVP